MPVEKHTGADPGPVVTTAFGVHAPSQDRLRYAAEFAGLVRSPLLVTYAGGAEEQPRVQALVAHLPYATAVPAPAPVGRERIEVVSAYDEGSTAPQLVLPPDPQPLLRDLSRLRLLVPYGSRTSGLRATRAVLDLLRVLRSGLQVEVFLYHTTWRAERVDSADPRHHMSPAAVGVEDQIRRTFQATGVECVSDVEMRETVEGGVNRCALERDADLIVMARGRETLVGSRVTNVIDRRCVPVLVADREAP